MLLAFAKFLKKFKIYKVFFFLNFFSSYNQIILYKNNKNIIIFTILLELFQYYKLLIRAINLIAQFIRIIL